MAVVADQATLVAASGTRVVDVPASTQNGDLLIYVCNSNGGADIGTAPGWTRILSETLSGNLHASVAWRIASSEPDTYNIGGSTAAWRTWCGRITGHNPASAPPILHVGQLSGTTVNPPSLNPTWPAAEVTLWLVLLFCDGATTASTFPANYSTEFNNGTTRGIYVGSRQLAADSEDPGSFTIGASTGTVTCTCAVRPAAAPASWVPRAVLLAAEDAWEKRRGILVPRLWKPRKPELVLA